MLTADELDEKYGKLYYKVTDSVDGHPCEIEYRSTVNDELVGYWAYGHYDYELDYVGQNLPYYVEHRY